jgi:pimeloyl-ACP methyl ester carboxylesterase
VLDTDIPHIREIFPQVEVQTMDTGHWVQAEKPEEFVDIVTEWLTRTAS